MPNLRSLRWLPSIALVVACNDGDASGSSQADPATGTTSTSSPSTGNSEPPTTSLSPTDMTSTGEANTTTTTSTTSDADTVAESGSSSGSTMDPTSAICGDGNVDPGEECDQSFKENSDKGPCTLSCKLAACGDGLIWAGQEICDNGPNNNDDLYGGCTTKCELAAHCNDGLVQGPEECDLADDNGTGEFPAKGVPCDSGCRYQARLVFLSGATYKGGELGGVEGAHLKCQALAEQAKFDNATKFMAWLSDAQHSPFQDFKHEIETVGLAYVLPNGVRVADDWNDLVLNGPGDGITVTELGEMVFDKRVWTGTAPSGKGFDPSAHCKAWSDSSPAYKSLIGRSSVDQQQPQDWAKWSSELQWTSFLMSGCNFPNRLYCFEQ